MGEKERNAVDVKDIAGKCLDSEGYLLFAAYLTPQRDPSGRLKIQFQYRRYHYSLEDAKQALEALKQFIDDDIKKIVEQAEKKEDSKIELN